MITDAKIKNAPLRNKDYKLPIEGGLYVLVKPSGTKLWRFKYRFAGREKLLSFGKYGNNKGCVSLAEARGSRDAAKAKLNLGLDPSAERKLVRAKQEQAASNTFEQTAQEWIERTSTAKRWTSARLKQLSRWLEGDVYPHIGLMPISDVEPVHLLKILTRIESRGAPHVALALRQIISKIFRFGIATLRCKYDQAAVLEGAIVRPKVRSHPHLGLDQLGELLRKVDAYGGTVIVKSAIKLMAHCFTRGNELRHARWSDINFEQALWTVPAEFVKTRQEFLVPLSPQALKILDELKSMTGYHQYVFPNQRGGKDMCMSRDAINRVLHNLGYRNDFSTHGFRSTASTALNEAGWDSKVVELQLAHTVKGTEGKYNRAAMLADRRKMLCAWSDMIDAVVLGAKVIPLNKKVGQAH